MGENEVLEQVLVIAHAMEGVVVNANSKQVSVKSCSGQCMAWAIGLKGKGAAQEDELLGMAEGMEPRHDSAQDHLDSTTNLVGLPQKRGEVSSPTPFFVHTVPSAKCSQHVACCEIVAAVCVGHAHGDKRASKISPGVLDGPETRGVC